MIFLALTTNFNLIQQSTHNASITIAHYKFLNTRFQPELERHARRNYIIDKKKLKKIEHAQQWDDSTWAVGLVTRSPRCQRRVEALHTQRVDRVDLLDVDPTLWAVGGRVVVVPHEHMHLLAAESVADAHDGV